MRLRGYAGIVHLSVLCQMTETMDLIHLFSFSSLEDDSSHKDKNGDDHDENWSDDTY